MRVCVDDLEEKMEFPPGFSLGEIINQLCTEKISQDRVITRVRVNGEELAEDESGLFPDVPGGEIDSLELETEHSFETGYRGIVDAKEYLKKLTSGIQETAELFRTGEEKRAHNRYALCMEGINWFIQILEGARQVMGLDYGTMVFNRVSVDSYIENLQHIIGEMLSA